MSTKPLIVGNWKLNPNNLKAAVTLAQDVAKGAKGKDAIVAIAPPFIYLSEVQKKISRGSVRLAAQDVAKEAMGAFTGEVSALQLRDLGTEYVIIGHSERRARGESDSEIAQKVLIALKNKLTPIVCIGEKERDSAGNFYSFVEKQIRSLTSGLKAADAKKVVIAYEPIWAIGTGATATKEDVKEMQLFIFSVLAKAYDRAVAKKVTLLYGGSVKPANAKELHAEGGMDGFLVGGASLKGKDFTEIIKAII